MPLFAVIIPVFNRSVELKSCLTNLSDQIFKDFEIIIVDDGSTDEITPAIYNHNFKLQIKYYYQSNLGVTAARNRGAELSEGKYLLFLDPDDSVADCWLSDFHSSILQNPDANIFFCGVTVIGPSKINVIACQNNSVQINLPLFKAGSFAIKNDFFSSIGKYDSRIKFGENTELGFRVIQSRVKAGFISSLNFTYCPSVNGGSKNLQNLIQGNDYVLKKHAEYFRQHKTLKKSYIQTMAVAKCRLDNSFAAVPLFFKAWLLKPLDLQSFSRLVISLIPPFAKRVWKPIK